MNNDHLNYDEIVDYIENFEKKNITLVFLFTNGRSGSVLLQSLLDSHPNIISTLFPFSFYENWNSMSYSSDSLESLTSKFFKYLIYSSSYDSYTKLGVNKDNSIISYLIKTRDIFIKVINLIKIINRKTFFLSFVFSLSKALNINLKNIKTILHHEHYFTSDFMSTDYQKLFKDSDILLDSIYHDFSRAKILITIRNPYQLYYSHLNFFKRNNIIHLPYFYSGLLNQLLFNFNYIDKIINKNQFDIKLIKFEDIHLKKEIILREIVDFLNIEFSSSLLITTIAGKLWWGNDPINKPVLGTNDKLNDIELDKVLDPQSKVLISVLFKDLDKKYNYKDLKFDILNSNIFLFIESEFESLIYLIFREFFFIDQFKAYSLKNYNKYEDSYIFFSEIYPIIRKKVLSFFSKKDNTDLNEVIDIFDIKIFIRNIYNKQFKCPKDAFFIFFSIWSKGYLPLEIVFHLNRLTDQIWVPNSFLKEIYINSGIIEDKINIVPFFLDKNSRENIYNKVNNKILYEVDTSVFNFLFVGDLTYDSGIDILIDAYEELFSKNSKVSLTIVNEKSYYIDDFYIKSDGIDFQSKEKDLFIINNDDWIVKKVQNIILNSDLNIKLVDSTKFDISKLYDNCNCFVYTFRYDVLCNNILEALFKGLPVITIKNGPVLDFCNDNNSYFVDSSIEYYENDTIEDIVLANNLFKFSPNRDHLKETLFYVYENISELKMKSDSCKNSVSNFAWNSSLDLIYKNIKALKGKQIFRYYFDDLKKSLDLEIKKALDNKDYIFAKEIIEKLIDYDIEYLFMLEKINIQYHN